MRRSPLPLLALAAVSTVVFAGCGDAHHGSGTPLPDHAMDGSMHDGSGHHDSMGHGRSSPVAPGARRIGVVASSFKFDPAEITVAVGEDVAIVLTSEDILHDFAVDGLDAHVVAAAGETAEGGLRADEAGRYRFYCTVPGHREAGMVGTLTVDEP